MRILVNDATRRAGLLLAAALLAGVPAAHGQDKKEEPQPGSSRIPIGIKPYLEGSVSAKSTLEEMLAEALKNNPDIRVAEAKLHEADAELNRARLTTMQKVITFHADWQAASSKVAFEEKRLKRMRELADQKAVDVRIVDESAASLAAAKAVLAAVEAQMPSLIGKPPLAAFQVHVEQPAIMPPRLQVDFQWDQHQTAALALIEEASRQVALSQEAPSSIANKLRVALETPLRVDFRETPLADVVEYLQDKSGITIRNQLSRYKEGNPKITVQFKEPLPLRAVLQAIEDELPFISGVGEIRFVVREYGLLVVPTSRVPREAILLDYLGHVGATTPAATATGKNPPPREIEGTVKAIDDKTSLVSVSVGSDDGLQRGHTLEVYRANPAKYVGTLRIVEVHAREAVGRMGTKQASVQVGDRVTSKLVGN